MADESLKVLVGITGSVASIKLKQLIQTLRNRIIGVSIKVVATKSSLHFVNSCEIDAHVLTDEDEWATWSRMGDDILHIELCKWADVMIIAPLDANTLAKIANGLCDNILTCIVRAWRRPKPLLFAVAMNSFMFEHPLTSQHIDVLKSLAYVYIPPVSKKLACGDIGVGAMASVDEIVNEIINCKQEKINE
eukprot:gene15326-16903_t